MARRKEPKIPDAILDQLLGGADPKTAFDPNGLLDDLKKALAERALNAEIDHHLANGEAGNSRNGYGKKTVVTDTARLELDVPRDRQSTFDPHLIAKYQRRFPGFAELQTSAMQNLRRLSPGPFRIAAYVCMAGALAIGAMMATGFLDAATKLSFAGKAIPIFNIPQSEPILIPRAYSLSDYERMARFGTVVSVATLIALGW